MNINRAISFAACALFANPSFAQDTLLIGDVPLPEDLEAAASTEQPFSGIWTGRWNSRRNHNLVIEGYDEDGLANVIYAVGRDRNGLANWFRSKARVEDEALVFEDEQFPARYSISPTGRMRGVYPGGDRFAILQHKELSDILTAPVDDWFSIGEHGFLPTNLVEEGKRVELAVAVYSPEGEGPFPFAMIHHGSTGSGENSYDFVWFFYQ